MQPFTGRSIISEVFYMINFLLVPGAGSQVMLMQNSTDFEQYWQKVKGQRFVMNTLREPPFYPLMINHTSFWPAVKYSINSVIQRTFITPPNFKGRGFQVQFFKTHQYSLERCSHAKIWAIWVIYTSKLNIYSE